MVEVDLDHQHAEDAALVAHGGAEVVTALAGGGAEAEETPQATLHGLTKIGAEGEVAVDEAVFLVPVGSCKRIALRVHQVDHVGAGLVAQAFEQAIGIVPHGRCFGLLQDCSQSWQVAEDARQYLVAVQRAEQVGDIEIEGLTVLLGQLVAVVALGELLQRPEQRREQQGQQGEVAPARATGRMQCSHAWAPGCRAHYARRAYRRSASLIEPTGLDWNDRAVEVLSRCLP